MQRTLSDRLSALLERGALGEVRAELNHFGFEVEPRERLLERLVAIAERLRGRQETSPSALGLAVALALALSHSRAGRA
ncbi:MAG TPA: hypothetical protein VGI10_08060 [Polyangiaceae bacterium]